MRRSSGPDIAPIEGAVRVEPRQLSGALSLLAAGSSLRGGDRDPAEIDVILVPARDGSPQAKGTAELQQRVGGLVAKFTIQEFHVGETPKGETTARRRVVGNLAVKSAGTETTSTEVVPATLDLAKDTQHFNDWYGKISVDHQPESNRSQRDEPTRRWRMPRFFNFGRN